MTSWEYQVICENLVENFQATLNKLGHEGWEAISGAYGVGESKKISLGHGMPLWTAVGAPAWSAVMKRAK